MSAWSLYDELIDAMPSGITVHDYCLGAHWTYIVADCGMGLAKNGAWRRQKPIQAKSRRRRP